MTYLSRPSPQYIDVEDMSSDETRLLNAARRGNEGAFLDLYQRHRTPVFRFAWRLTGSVAAAEDITQECFLALLAGAAFEVRLGALRTYLYGITRNLAFKRLRQIEREQDEPEDITASSADTLGDILAVERAVLVQDAIGELPPLQKEALILFEYEELSLEEIATIAEVEVGAVKARLHRARESLRRRLAPLFAPCPERNCS